MAAISGKTRICGIIGFPVEHTFSPAMHNAAFQHMGLDLAYVPFSVNPGDLTAAVTAVRSLNLAGVNVTVPHKRRVAGLLDELSPDARLSGAVNTIVNNNGLLTGHNTDGEGFIRALRQEAGIDPAAGPALILGAGGAARAVAVALALSGAPEIIIANRTMGRASELAAMISGETPCISSALVWTGKPRPDSPEYNEWVRVLGRSVLIVQTTSLGMHPREGEIPPFPFGLVGKGHVAVDLVYNPAITGFMSECRSAGARVFNGLGMLLHQGVIAFELWTGHTPPVEVMRQALEESIKTKESSRAKT